MKCLSAVVRVSHFHFAIRHDPEVFLLNNSNGAQYWLIQYSGFISVISSPSSPQLLTEKGYIVRQYCLLILQSLARHYRIVIQSSLRP